MTMADTASRRGLETVHANGIDIAYREVGDGPPLVLLHGGMAATGPAWAGSPVAYVDHLDRLAERCRVIAPETRTSGATVHDGGPATFDVLTDDVVALIEALGLERPFVAGFSEGGATATLVALHHPELVRGLVNHAGFDYFDPHAMMHDGLPQIFGGRPDATEADPDAAEQAFQHMGPQAIDSFARMKADYDDAQGDGHWRRYLGLFFERSVADIGATTEDLARIRVPTLVLVGDQDFFCPVELACTLYRTLPAGELAIVPGLEHSINDVVVGAMIDFLGRHAG